MVTPVNPYARTAATAAARRGKENGGPQQQPQQLEMGPQSQRQLTLQDRTHKMQSESHRKKKKGGQQTLFGDAAFDPIKDCEKCRGKAYGRDVHRAHHPRCINNRRTKGFSEATVALEREAKRLKTLFSQPLTEAEKCSGQYITKEACHTFFAPKGAPAGSKTISITTAMPMPMEETRSSTATENYLSAANLSSAVTTIINDPKFAEEHKDSRVPLAMIAFARVVVTKIILDKRVDVGCHFDGLTTSVPATEEMEPHYHSIVGQKLLNVDWKAMYGIDVPCVKCGKAVLANDRTNFSKNKILFPTFVIDGPPQWCMVQSMQCPRCKWRVAANSCETLCSLPACARASYPVETKCALNKNSHVGRSATEVMDLIMPTYGNGDLCSRTLYNAVNRACIERVEN